MRIYYKILLAALVVTLAGGRLAAQSPQTAPTPAERVVTFRFVRGDDMFYRPEGNNAAELERLYALVDEYRAEIASGTMPVRVDGYCASPTTAKENLHTAFVRANRVKSELITHKGLAEDNFITKNYAATYTAPDGKTQSDVVVVTLRIPVKAVPPIYELTEAEKQRAREREEQARRQQQERERAEAERARAQAEKERMERERTEQQPPVADALAGLMGDPVTPAKPYRFAVRTNLLYDAFLLPTLGVEWRAGRDWGVKLDGSRAHWGNEHGRVQKVWLVNPEVRRYLGERKRLYVGAAANFGEYNIYKGMLGGLFSDDTGYQGKLWGAGLTVGYQLCLSRSFSLDFNLGLGYTRSEYDSFNITDGVRVFKQRDRTKNFWGPTQAGVNLVWTIGNNK